MPIFLSKKLRREIPSVETEVQKRISEGDVHSFFYVVPTKRKVRELRRTLLTFSKNGVAPEFPLYTLNTLARMFHSAFCPAKIELDLHQQAIFLTDIVKEKEEELFYFFKFGRKHNLPRGTFRKILDAINYYREKGITPAELQKDLRGLPDEETAKLRDILTIYECYDAALGTRYIDNNGYLLEVNDYCRQHKVPELFSGKFPRCTSLFISGFDEFNTPELECINNLSDANIETILLFDYFPRNDSLFGHLKENYQRLQSFGFQARMIDEPKQQKTFPAFIASQLFNEEGKGEQNPAKNLLTLIEAPNRIEEIEIVAKQIKRLNRQHPKMDLSKVCIAMRNTVEYTTSIREVFHKYGIPANFTDRYLLDQSPVVIAIVSLLEILVRDYRLQDVLRSLSTTYATFKSETEEIIDTANLFSIAARLKIPRGKTLWLERIEERLKLMALEVPVDEYDETKKQQETNALIKAKKDVEFLQQLLSPFERELTPGEFRAELFALISKVNVVSNIVSASIKESTVTLEKDVKAYQQFLTIVDEIIELWHHEGKESERRAIDFYVEYLKRAITEVRYNIRQQYGYGVLVTTLEETRGLQFDTMFIIGMVDGEFPKPYETEIFLSPPQRKRREEYALKEQRYLFYQGLTNFTNHVYLSFPAKDGEKDLVPSSFLDAVRSVCEVEEWKDDMTGELKYGIYSLDDLYKWEGATTTAEFAQNYINHAIKETLAKIPRSVEIELARQYETECDEYRGIIFQHVSPVLKNKLLRKKESVYSVSQLETYGKCPFQFFAKRVLRLAEMEEMDEEISVRDLGNMLHRILFEFYDERRVNNLPAMHNCIEAEFESAVARLKEIAYEKLSALEIPDVFWRFEMEKILGDGKTIPGTLEEILRLERQTNFDELPSFFEVSFGNALMPVTIDGIRLRGKIDRIDAGGGMFSIIDYKTGKVPETKTKPLGFYLQLPLYLLATEQILKKQTGKTMRPASGIFFGIAGVPKLTVGLSSKTKAEITERVKERKTITINHQAEFETERSNAVTASKRYVDGIAHGEFPLTTVEKANLVCNYCEYSSVCRVRMREQEIEYDDGE